MPAGGFGPRLRAILSVLAGAYRLGKRPIQQLASDLYAILHGLHDEAGHIGEAYLLLKTHAREQT